MKPCPYCNIDIDGNVLVPDGWRQVNAIDCPQCGGTGLVPEPVGEEAEVPAA